MEELKRSQLNSSQITMPPAADALLAARESALETNRPDDDDVITLAESEILTIKARSVSDGSHGDAGAHRGVLVIYTGGTLGMKRNAQGSLQPAPGYLTDRMQYMTEFGEPDMPAVDLIETRPILDSSDMTPKHWLFIANLIEKNYFDYDGFVVISGTDTMSYFASALSFMLENLGKPVVLTGSMVPLVEIFNDARRNLVVSIVIAGYIEVPEVCLFMNDKLMRGNRTTKTNSMGLDAFASPNFPALVELATGFRLRKPLFQAMPRARLRVHRVFDTNIAVWRMLPGFSDDYIVTAIEHTTSLRAIVLELYGTGNIQTKTQLLDAISLAMSKGIAVVAASQCLKGAVDLEAYALGRQLKDAGVISGLDMTKEALVTKLAYLLGKPNMNLSRLRVLMAQNLRGELSEDPSFRTPHRPSASEFIDTISTMAARL